MLQIKNMEFAYQKNSKLFNNLNFEMKKGNIYGLLGKNGAGKSTLLKAMMGLLYPKSGTITFDSLDVTQRLPQVLEQCYYIPEEFHLPALSTDDYIKIFGAFYSKFDTQQMLRLMHELEIPKTKSLQNFSFGMKKKFIIAFALSSNCSYVFMDEPTNGLDIPSKSKFRKIVATEINEERSFIISTHQVRDLENLIDPLVIIEGGKIVFEHDIYTLSEKLAFLKVNKGEEADGEVLYKEDIFGGEYAICKNDGHETPIDFELLFNGVLANHKIISEHLKSN